jgi:hypothetical protein
MATGPSVGTYTPQPEILSNSALQKMHAVVLRNIKGSETMITQSGGGYKYNELLHAKDCVFLQSISATYQSTG